MLGSTPVFVRGRSAAKAHRPICQQPAYRISTRRRLLRAKRCVQSSRRNRVLWWSRNMVIYWYYRNHQQTTMTARMQKRWSIKQKTIDFSTMRYRSVHFRQFFGACLQSKRSRGWEQGESSATWNPLAMHSTEYGWSWTEDGIPRRR